MNIISSVRLEERKIGKEKIDILRKSTTKILIIHYSCESFFNLDGRTPRITSICIKDRGTNDIITFSIHIQAQIDGNALSTLTDSQYNSLEKKMLIDFYRFVEKNSNKYWIHWNMRNTNFGFEAISNRFKILGGKPKTIPSDHKFDLSSIIGHLYTFQFEYHEPNGQLLNLAHNNNITTRDAMIGADEAQAFEDKNFLKLHMSTGRKIEIIDRILLLEEKGKLKVKTGLLKQYGLSISGIFEIIRNNRFLFIIWSVIIWILGIVYEPLVKKILHLE